MYQRDYILRMVEQMASGLSVIMGLRREQKPQQALATVDELLNRLFRLNSRLANSLSEKDLIAMLSLGGEPETEKLVLLATLIREEGEIYAETEQPEQAYSRFLRALHILLAASEHGGEQSPELMEQAEASLAGLREYALPSATQLRLLGFWEQAARYDKAEDALFELLESNPTDENAFRAGSSFYQRLLELPDEALTSGGLPRDEVIEGWNQLKGMNVSL